MECLCEISSHQTSAGTELEISKRICGRPLTFPLGRLKDSGGAPLSRVITLLKTAKRDDRQSQFEKKKQFNLHH